MRALACLSFCMLPAPRFAWRHLRVSRDVDLLAFSLANLFSHRESAARVGREYLRVRPDEGNLNSLIDLICLSRPERRAELAKANTKRRRELLALQQREDFEQCRIVKVHGWILSETEARLCAVAALA